MKNIFKNKPTYLWKSLTAGMKSKADGSSWAIGKWRKEESISICNSGFHASEQPLQAMGYVDCEVLAKVEVRGESEKHYDKQCWSEMRIVKAYEWTKEDSVYLAVFAAELVIDIYEKKYPNDKRPREAIEAAKEWIKNPNANAANANAANAYAAAAAANAYAAANAAAAYAYAAAANAYAAAYAAAAAATAATAATAAAANAANAAAAATAAAANAANAAAGIRDKCNAFILKRIALKK